MFENQVEELVEEAISLAFSAFDEPSDGHIDCIFERLSINFLWGLGDAGVTTVH